MADDKVRSDVSRLLDALESMANEAGRKGLTMHPSRHDQAVDRVIEIMEKQNAAMREIVEAVAEWGIGGLMPADYYRQAVAFIAAHPTKKSADAS
ncbi:MAG TPA: hypothetical protein VFN11_14290 [Ktedonobacterales bacterium]|nr:hypothetical protein [Ktedonobacterales bacterium]